jgi:hypothetical protein
LGGALVGAGDSNVVIRLGASRSYARRMSQNPSLTGRPLPDLAALDLRSGAAPAGKPILLCLFDLEQRPSRRFVRQLAEQHEALKRQGLVVLGVQAAITTGEAFKAWKDSSPVPFPVGRLTERTDKTQWASDLRSLPWLILTDGNRHVTAEGFSLEELDVKLKAQSK